MRAKLLACAKNLDSYELARIIEIEIDHVTRSGPSPSASMS